MTLQGLGCSEKSQFQKVSYCVVLLNDHILEVENRLMTAKASGRKEGDPQGTGGREIW